MKRLSLPLPILIGYAATFVGLSAFAQRATPIPSRSETKETKATEKSAPASATACQPIVDVCDVLKQYAALTHFRLIHDNFVQGKVSLDVSGLPPEKAIDSIERTLFANGDTIVQVDPDTVEIVGTGKNPRTAGVQIITEPKDLPRGERVVSYLFKLNYADPTELQQVLGQYLSPPQTYTSFLALPKERALLITERTSVIRRLSEIIAAVDVAGATKVP